MAGFIMRAVEFTVPASTGDADITLADFGTPKGFMIFLQRATADGTAAVHCVMSIGFSDGTNDVMFSSNLEDAQAASDSGVTYRNDVVAAIHTPGTGTIEESAAFDSFITNGIRLNWGTVSGNQPKGYVVLIGGDNAQVAVGNEDAIGAAETTNVISSAGFTPTLVGMTCVGRNNINAGAINARPSLGFADASGNYATLIASDDDGATTMDCAGRVMTTGLPGKVNFADGSIQWQAEVEDFGGAGDFTIRVKDGTGDMVGWIAIDTGDAAVKIDTFACPNSSGSSTLAVTGVGFKPQCVIGIPSIHDGLDANKSHYSFGIGAWDEDGGEGCVANAAQDNIADSIADQAYFSSAVQILANGGADYCQADWVSMDVDGFTLEFSTVQSIARPDVPFLAIETEAGAAERHYPRGVMRGEKRGVA